MNSPFSVLLSVYSKEQPSFLDKSLWSIINQSRRPQEVVIVKDGVLTEALDRVIETYRVKYADLISVVGYEKNMGLGEALNYGMKFVHTPFVARMDADDIAVHERFEMQMAYLEQHPEIDVLGTCIAEFNDDPGQIIRSRIVPEGHEQIVQKASLTNPMNHMTVVFKKDRVLEAGGYQHAPYFEDYDLWVRMLSRGMKFHNLQKDLVLARIGNDMVGKRHGLKYSGHEFNHFRNMHKYGFISIFALWKAMALRMPLRLLPKSMLSLLYRTVLRS